MLKRSLLAVLLTAFAFPLLAQNAPRPDLSGTWKLNRAASKLAKDAPAGSETIYIDCMGSTIYMNVTAETTNQFQKFVTDGDVHVVAETEPFALVRNAQQLLHVAYWDKSSLVTETSIQTVLDTGYAFSVMPPFIERWTLSPDGRRLFRRHDDPKQTLVYDKQ